MKTQQPALQASFATGGVHLVEVPVDYSDNKRMLVEGLSALVCQL